MKDSNRSIWSWAFYDWANSAFATTVMAGFFPVFFKSYWSLGTSVQQSTFYLGLANSAASILVAASAPILGAIADRGGLKKGLLIFFAYLGCIMTGGLWFIQSGQWVMAVIFYITATVGFSGANIFYDSLLPSVASAKKIDFTSSLGFGLGYIGGGLLFLVNVVMYLKPELFGIPDGAVAIRIAFISVAIWWALFSIPIMLFVEEPELQETVPLRHAVSAGFIQLRQTFRKVRHLKVVGMFLIAYWLYIDGVDTIIRMAVDYGSSIGFPAESLITALLLVQFIAFPATLLFNLFGKRIGVKQALLTAIAAYTGIAVLGYFMVSTWHFYALASAIGLFQGGIQALSRSFYTRLIPEAQAAEFFGFFNLLGKFAAVIGPVLMGTITVISGSNRLGILSITILFIAGALVLTRVDEQEGKRNLVAYERELDL
ncbi:MAG: MFS transporter [Spirochaetia bacterium]|nr:MFS transporter [Spirochaetia bacterium]MCF7942472.1 MFS transporter [Spirochaetia bacterium]